MIRMIMAMFAFVGDWLVRKDDLYSYQGMEKTMKTAHSFALQSEWIASFESLGEECGSTSTDSGESHPCLCHFLGPSTDLRFGSFVTDRSIRRMKKH